MRVAGTGERDQPGNVLGIASDQDDPRGGYRDVGPATDGDADVGAGQGRRVVYPVADHRHALPHLLQLDNLLVLVFREHPGEDGVDTQLPGHGLCHRRAVAGQQDHLHPHCAQALDGREALRADNVGQGESRADPTAFDQVDHRLAFVACLPGELLERFGETQLELLEQPRPADGDRRPFHLRRHAAAFLRFKAGDPRQG